MGFKLHGSRVRGLQFAGWPVTALPAASSGKSLHNKCLSSHRGRPLRLRAMACLSLGGFTGGDADISPSQRRNDMSDRTASPARKLIRLPYRAPARPRSELEATVPERHQNLLQFPTAPRRQGEAG
jgi:hypothetical protein